MHTAARRARSCRGRNSTPRRRGRKRRDARHIMGQHPMSTGAAFRAARCGLALAAALSIFVSPARGAECRATSGPRTAALVELYTSEGCSSCPPADRWLSALDGGGQVPGTIVPIALHVDYWDYIGWKDPYANREFSLRQRKLSQQQRLALVYTPQVVLQGRDFRGWGTPAFDAAVAKITAQPAKASISLALQAAQGGALRVEAAAEVIDRAQQADAALYIAAYQNRLSSKVTAGENRGRTLAHDYVVLEWQGPFGFDPQARLLERRDLALVPKAGPGDSGVAAFVQNRRTGEVLQALMLPACPG